MPRLPTLKRANPTAPRARRGRPPRRIVGGAWLIALGLGSCTFPDYQLGPRLGPDAGASAGGSAGGGVGGASGASANGVGANGGSASGVGGTSGGVSGTATTVGGASGDGAGGAGEAGANLGPPGQGIAFEGNQLIVFGLAPFDNMTIEMWIKTTQVGPTGKWYQGAALFDADTGGDHNDFGASLIGEAFGFGTGSPDVTALSTTPVNTGVWTHVAGTRERSSSIVSVLVNGKAESKLVTGNYNPLSDAVTPSMGGHLAGNFYNGFVGVIDEVRLWNEVRTPRQITDYMHSRLNGNEPGLVGYWRFDDGQGLVAADSSPSHNQGTLGAGNSSHVPQWVTYDPPALP